MASPDWMNVGRVLANFNVPESIALPHAGKTILHLCKSLFTSSAHSLQRSVNLSNKDTLHIYQVKHAQTD